MKKYFFKTSLFILFVLFSGSCWADSLDSYVTAAQIHISVTHHLVTDVFLNGNKIIDATQHLNDAQADITQDLTADQLCFFYRRNVLGVQVDQTLEASAGTNSVIGVAYVMEITLSDRSTVWVTSDDGKAVQYHHNGNEPSGWFNRNFDDRSWPRAEIFDPTSMVTTLINPQTNSAAKYFKTFTDGDDNLMHQTSGERFYFRQRFELVVGIPPNCLPPGFAQSTSSANAPSVAVAVIPGEAAIAAVPTSIPTPIPTSTPRPKPTSTFTALPTATPVPLKPTSTPQPVWTPRPFYTPTPTRTLEFWNRPYVRPTATFTPWLPPVTRPALPPQSVWTAPPLPTAVSRPVLIKPTRVPRRWTPTATIPISVSQNSYAPPSLPTSTSTPLPVRKKRPTATPVPRVRVAPTLTPVPQAAEAESVIAFSSLPVNIDASFADGPGRYLCEIVDAQGNHINTIYNKQVAFEKESWISWDGTNDQGQLVHYGLYYAVFSKDGRLIQKIRLNWTAPK